MYLVLGKFNSFFLSFEEGVQPQTVSTQNGRYILTTLDIERRKSQYFTHLIIFLVVLRTPSVASQKSAVKP